MNSGGALVSVIIPTRNSARTIAACLASVRSQEYRPVELVVVDNGSTDSTVMIANRQADVVDAYGPERSAQRNRGAQISHGEYLLFVDSDMTLEPQVISECVDTLRESGAPAVVIPEVSIGEGFWAHCRALERSCYVGDDNIEAARFFLRSVFEAAGGFDEALVAFEDWDLSKRISGGSRLPRSDSRISHDEGQLRLAVVLAKKRYYAASLVTYWRKHRGSTLSQANPLFRPAFVRNWRRLLRHPILTIGILTLKSLESGAAMWGIVETSIRSSRVPG